MLIEISALPPAIQEQILSVKQGETVQFIHHGKLIGNFKRPSEDSLMAAAGLLQGCGIDGLEYERQIRSEWD